MILNYEIHQNSQSSQIPLVFIHGLFGSLSNLGMLARAFQQSHSVVQIDLRNHGHSAHDKEMNYFDMANDVLETLDYLNIKKFSVVGHSMGGKVAMQLALSSDRVEQLAVLDIAPYAYKERHHDEIFQALFAVEQANIETRQQAIEIMREYISVEMVIQFLLKSFSKGKWLFNIHALYNHYQDVTGWPNSETAWQNEALFLKGSLSPYISKPEHMEALAKHFPHAEVIEVEGAGHWLHAEKTQQVLDQLQTYIV